MLVIIGLLVGTVVVGQTMIKNYLLRSIVSEKEGLESAVNAFKMKYACLPGDCLKATSFFTSVGNGDGNDRIFALYPHEGFSFLPTSSARR